MAQVVCFKQGGLRLLITILTHLSEIVPNHAIILNMETPIYISGLDSTELSNLFKHWFKWDRLKEIIKTNEEVKALGLTDEAISTIVYAIEDEIRQSLIEYANQLEESRKELDAFFKGASWVLGHKNEPEEF